MLTPSGGCPFTLFRPYSMKGAPFDTRDAVRHASTKEILLSLEKPIIIFIYGMILIYRTST